jgi:hypothetical protein
MMMVENIARLEEIRYAFQILSGNSTRKDYLRGFGVGDMILLKRILEKQGVK